MSAENTIAAFQGPAHTDRSGLLSNRQMDRAAHLLSTVMSGNCIFDKANPKHITVQAKLSAHQAVRRFRHVFTP